MKEWLKRNYQSIIYIILLTLMYFHFESQKESYKDSIKVLKTEIRNYKLKDGTLVASAEINQLEVKRLKEVIKNSSPKTKLLANKFHKIKSISSSSQSVKIDTIKVEFKNESKDSVHKIQPFKFEGEKIDKFYSFKYKVTDKNLSLYNLSLTNDTVTRITGIKRSWLFGKETYTIDEIHSNPYFVTQGMQSFEIKTKTPWYNSKVVWFLAGGATIYYITK